MCVEDSLNAATSTDSAKSLIEDLIKKFNADGLELRKWAKSNEPNAIPYLPESLKDSSIPEP